MKKYLQLALLVAFGQRLFAQMPENIESSLILLNIKTGKERIILKEKRHFEAPNWSPEGNFLIINSNGFLEKISTSGKKLGLINTGFATQCNNDHGISFDGKILIISHNDSTVADGFNSRIFVLPVNGGKPKLVTKNFPSYWHGISRDAKTLLYCAYRNDAWDIFSISINGGTETRLTTIDGLDDGPEYSADGKLIYFNSNRTGRMHLFEMNADGKEQKQLTFDEYDNWFPHPSPDGKWIAYLSYLEDQKGRHPFGKSVKIRLMNIKSKKVKDITPVFYGGQGTLNVNSWSPDSHWIAYVRYRININ